MTSDTDDSAGSEQEARAQEPPGPPPPRVVSGGGALFEPVRPLGAVIKMQLPDIAMIEGLTAGAAAAQQLYVGAETFEALIVDAKILQQRIGHLAKHILSPAAEQLAADLQRNREVMRQIADSAVFKLPDFRKWAEAFATCLPDNLHSARDMSDAYDIALEEGIPFSWIPRPDIVSALIDADGPQQRSCILSESRDDVLEDCDAALAPFLDERAAQCRAAVDALRRGIHGPAQSHAANILDSIVRDLSVSGKPKDAVDLARRDIDEFSFRVAAEMLTLRPLVRAYVEWRPKTGEPIPSHFARHPTTHAVGQSGVFEPQYALVAVMLATSLVVQFGRDLP